jgi:selenocysteine-specific elongation factor
VKSNIIIGTAGHVDHGKTTLIKALTQIDTDRLKEEKERGISIDLGFASLSLPNGITVGIVDVPGHERYIKNMLAGAGNIDLVLLTIAADEGVMPQTREHLDILRFLNVRGGLTVITKADLVDDEWRELIIEETRLALRDSFLADWPIIPVSAVTGEGLEDLVNLLSDLVNGLPPRDLHQPARLPVDRVFTVPGFGTVVTGSLVAGEIKAEQLLEVLPGGKKVRVRQVQVFGQKTQKAQAGGRVALNVANLAVDEITRGMILAEPNKFIPSDLIDLRVELLNSLERPLKNRTRVRFHHGTAEILGRITILEEDQLEPGQSGLAQVILEQPIAAAKGDRFVIRSYSPQTTLGGGTVLNPNPAGRHRRKKQSIINDLLNREVGDPLELLSAQLLQSPLEELEEEGLRFRTGLSGGQLQEILITLENEGKVLPVSVGQTVYYLHQIRAERILTKLLNCLNQHHQKQPLARGVKKEVLQAALDEKMSRKFFEQLLKLYEVRVEIQISGFFVALRAYIPRLTEEQEEIKNKLLGLYWEAAYQPPSSADALAGLGGKLTENNQIMAFLIEQGELVKLGDNLYFHHQRIEEAKTIVTDFLSQEGEIALGKMRDLLKTSRKYALALGEHFDQIKLTRRVGENRVAYLQK